MVHNKINKENILQKIRNKELKYVDFTNLSEELRGDKDIFIGAIKYLPKTIIIGISKELRNDKEVGLEIVKKNGNLLGELSEELRDNKEVVLEAIKNSGNALQSVSKRLQDDKEIVLEAVRNIGGALYYASDRLKDDKETVLKMLEVGVPKGEGWLLIYASERLQNDKDCLELLEKTNLENLNKYYQDWYKSRVEVLNNIRDKEIMESSIVKNIIVSKNIKF